jgi:hypothetical protein
MRAAMAVQAVQPLSAAQSSNFDINWPKEGGFSLAQRRSTWPAGMEGIPPAGPVHRLADWVTGLSVKGNVSVPEWTRWAPAKASKVGQILNACVVLSR